MTSASSSVPSPQRRTGRWIVGGLLLGLICGLLFGEYCKVLETVGEVYVSLLQMTVLPYLVVSLIAKMGRLDAEQAKRMGLVGIAVLAVLWIIGVIVIVLVAGVLPPAEGASFFSPSAEQTEASSDLARFIPVNVFRSLSDELVPGVVLFCLFFGAALIAVPGKEPLLEFLDLCGAGLSRINVILVRLSPIGLFALTASAAGTLRIDELSRLQAYLVLFTLACALAAFGILPLFVSSLTHIRYRDVLRAAQEPLLTALATGKLFVVLPQLVDQCERLLGQRKADDAESTASVLVPLAYPFPHLGKLFAFVFISFAGWYVGRALSFSETAVMAVTGAMSSFASPLVSMPYLLDQYQLPQDLMPLFILPGFLTTRLADLVGVVHLMAVTLIVNQALVGELRVQWKRLLAATGGLLVCLLVAGGACRWYLASTTLEYDLGERLLSLELSLPTTESTVLDAPDGEAQRPPMSIERIREVGVLRVGFHEDRLPYCFFNRQNELVGMDVELMHRLAARLDAKIEFVPYSTETADRQVEMRDFDVAIGGLLMSPQRFLRFGGFTASYEEATIAVVVRDHRRGGFDTWDDPDMPAGTRLAVGFDDMVEPARQRFPNADVGTVPSIRHFFENPDEHDALIIPGEVGAAWNILHPDYSVVVPEPAIRLPVGFVVTSDDANWIRFLDAWLDFEKSAGTLDRLREYWVQGGGTKQRRPRWCVLRDVLHWLP